MLLSMPLLLLVDEHSLVITPNVRLFIFYLFCFLRPNERSIQVLHKYNSCISYHFSFSYISPLGLLRVLSLMPRFPYNKALQLTVGYCLKQCSILIPSSCICNGLEIDTHSVIIPFLIVRIDFSFFFS